MNPADKRLAVEVEDHPLDYAGFEGEIPDGNYGAGKVEIWDKGTYTPVEKYGDVEKALKDGVVEVEMHGRKLKGISTLVHTDLDGKDNNWLLMKKDDQYAIHEHYDAGDLKP